jgi:nicotinamidase-related amidase
MVVVDMQYIDAHRAYGFGRWLVTDYPEFGEYYCGRLEAVVIPNIERLLATFRAARIRVIHLTLGPVLPDGSDYAGLDASHMEETDTSDTKRSFHTGTVEHAILPELEPLPNELVVNKTSRGAFNSTALERTLRNMGIHTLVVTGVATSVCVDLTARDAADRGFQVIVVEDATADLTESWHQAALLQFALRWGVVMTSDEAVIALGLERVLTP